MLLSGTSTHPFSTLLFCFSPTTTHSSFSFHSCFFVSVAIADKKTRSGNAAVRGVSSRARRARTGKKRKRLE